MSVNRPEISHKSFRARAEGQIFGLNAETRVDDRLRVTEFETGRGHVSSKIVDDDTPVQGLREYLNDEVLTSAIKNFLKDFSCPILENPVIHLLLGSGFNIVLRVERRWVVNEDTQHPLLVIYGKSELT
jgi:hypothetical protein